ncbi:MAG: GNAT family N-acetyltransferase [Actinomycetota bacterium]
MELIDGITHLRTPVADDAPAIATAVQESLDLLRPWMPWATDDYDTASAKEWIDGVFDASEHRFLITEHGRVLGACGLNRIDPLNRTANLGYWLHGDAVGRGHATRATRLVAGHGLALDEIELIQIEMSTENEPSRRVAERAGAAYEGVLRSRLLLQGRRHDVHVFTFTGGEV